MLRIVRLDIINTGRGTNRMQRCAGWLAKAATGKLLRRPGGGMCASPGPLQRFVAQTWFGRRPPSLARESEAWA